MFLLRRLKYFSSLFIILMPLILYSCSASSTVRYNRNEEKTQKENKGTEKKTYKETFDISPYRTKIDIKDNTVSKDSSIETDVWYGYEQKDTTANQVKTIVGTINGFRVQVMATDKLEEADSLKSDLALKLTEKNVYVIFDPPFYKVEVGDFTNMGDAKDLNFKLTQMGYTESRVISSTVNIYE